MPTLRKDNKGYYFVDYSVNGIRKRKYCGPGSQGKRDAELALSRAITEVRREKTGEIEDILIQRFLIEYLDYSYVNKARSTYRYDLCALEHLKQYFIHKGIGDNRPISDVTNKLMEGYKTWRIKIGGVKKSTVNRELNTIKAAFRKAVEWGYLSTNLMSSVKRFKEPKRHPRFFSHEEIQKILSHSTRTIKDIAFFLLHTGLRRGELTHLEWNDVDLKQNRIYIQPKNDWSPKDYEARTIPLNKELKEFLLHLPRTGRHVFSKPEGDRFIYHPNALTQTFIKILDQIGIKNASIHTLRHTYASYLVMAGVDITTVQKLLGHSRVATTMRYAHLSPDHLRDAADKLGKSFCHFSALTMQKEVTNGKILKLKRCDITSK
jgi:integrase